MSFNNNVGQERQYRIVAENYPDNIVRYDRECRAMYANRTFLESLPFQAELCLGKTPLEIFLNGNHAIPYPETVHLEATIKLALNTGISKEVSVHVSLPTGEVRTHSILITPERDEDGHIIAALAIGRDISGQRAAEKRFRELHNRLEAVFTNLPDPVWLKDVNGIYLTCNPAFENYFGTSCAEVAGNTDFDFFDADFALFCAQKDAEVISSRAIQICEKRIHSASNEKDILLEIRKAPVYGDDNTIVGIVSIGRDLTDHKEIEQSLREREELYSTIVNQAPDGVVLVDAETVRFVEFNDMACLGLGYSREEFAELTPFDINAEFTPEEHLRRISSNSKGKYLVFETLHRHRDGSLRNVLVSLKKIELRQRQFFIAVWTDISAKSSMERELKESYQRLDRLFSFLPDATFAIDLEGMVVAWNKAMETLTGAKAGEILGKKCLECSTAFYGVNRPLLADVVLSGQVDVKQWYEHFQKMDSKVTANDICIKKPQGDVMYFSAITAPMFDAEGKMIGVIEQIRDETEKYNAEAERKRLTEQLHQARKMEAIGQLAGGVANDFNNILTTIIGFTQIIKKKVGIDSPLNCFLDKILSSSERATSLTSSLLDFSRKRVIQARPLDLVNAITSTQPFIARLLRGDIKLSVSSRNEQVTVLAEETQLIQILLNLTANARDSMPHGGNICITVSTVIIDQEFIEHHGFGRVGTFALVAFGDTGNGMAEETRERIFEPFFTTKETGKGTGLGLATVYGIVKQLGGFINVYSEPGQGTVFRIYLPLIDYDAELQASIPADATQFTGTKTILLAEDGHTSEKSRKPF